MKINYSIQKILLSLLVFPLFISGCGGVIGNIDRYTFDLPKNELDSIVNEIFISNPEMSIPDSSIYKQDNETKLCLIKNGDKLIVFGFSSMVFNDAGLIRNDKSEIALTHVGVYGLNLQVDKNIPYFKKRTYKELFQSQFINKLNSLLNAKTISN